ncbi:MAG: ATP-dependent Clp protease ATP-binding subunit [Clostridiales bacterium]|nr:ATP-dependent Clp protease ATP-binding subunit [Clostridiales bacterium]
MQPTLCSKCHKNVAVVFITKIENNESKNEGLCLKCAKELGIKPVDDMIQRLGISDDDLDGLTSEMMNAFGGPEAMESLPELSQQEDNDDEDDEGKTATFPFLNKLFNSNQPPREGGERRQESREKDEKKKENRPQKLKYLENYCVSLTNRAREGKLDRVIGREEEISRVIQILNRRQKNNPCLIGEPGVGKTAIAEGLAQRIAAGNVPYKLKEKEVYLLDLTALVAGTQFRGQFESRMKGLIEEIKKVGNVILVIDEIHNIVGAGDAEGSMNAANILKPALSRGEIQVIGATTFNEYRKYIEKDAALERRFQPVTVAEPSIEDSVQVIMGIARYYENFHQVTIPAAVAREAVLLSERYITDRYLPDKAIDLIDEACSDVNLHNQSLARRSELEKDKADLEKEMELLSGQSDEFTNRKTQELTANERKQSRCRQEQATLNQARQTLRTNTSLTDEERDERLALNEKQMQKNQEQLRTLQEERRRIQAETDTASYEQRAIVQSKILRVQQQLDEMGSQPAPELTMEHLARVIEQWTGIPASRIEEAEFSRLSKLDERLKSHIIGQDQAVDAVTRAIRRNRVGISPKHKPVSFIFVGSTGVGKTELVKQLAADLFDTPDSLIRLDMSEYMEKYAVSRIIGSPPGYVGYDEAGQLTEKVRRKPYCVILFDEIEKAHPDVLNILLQILDDGRITDAHGRTVNFEHAVIVMTSNAGSASKEGTVGFGRSIDEQDEERTMKALQSFLRPEFINRVDEIIHFNRLTEENFKGITNIMLNELKDSLSDKNINFMWDDALVDYLTEKSYSLTYGARNLRRLIQRELEDAIASLLINQYMESITQVKATVVDGNIQLLSM